LLAHVQPRGLGRVLIEVNLELPNGNIYTPDLLFYTPQTAAQIDTQRGYVRGVPDLVVEILSPSTAEYDRTQKMGDYAACAVPWVWLIDQETLLVEEYQWTPEGYLRRQAVDARTPFRPHLFPEADWLPSFAVSLHPHHGHERQRLHDGNDERDFACGGLPCGSLHLAPCVRHSRAHRHRRRAD